MKLRSWRMVKRKHSSDAFSGEGARRFGGRWNSRGVPIVYTAEHASLAVLEILVHLGHPPLLQDYVVFRLDFEDSLVEAIDESTLPGDWNSYPARAGLRVIGDRWLADGQSAVLSVPSAIVPLELLFLLNPQHSDFPRIKIGKPQPFSFDPRLLRQ